MNRSDQIRAALRARGGPMTLAEIAEFHGWDQIDKNSATTNLGQMKKRGEVVISVSDSRAAYDLVPGWVPGRAANGTAAAVLARDLTGQDCGADPDVRISARGVEIVPGGDEDNPAGVMLAPPARLPPPGVVVVKPGGAMTSEAQVERFRKVQCQLLSSLRETLQDGAGLAVLEAFLETSRILGGVPS